ncbi:hypothetical protein C7974DRAFT_375009 [Boeremia exigua]|uniref:uncharacterized protein n=1 Tax=Boeremia exigua TaxID=749465 RepID=UPI001E8D79EA|nr:uncharacterized protein C7974DRAFT_375009 [Boeremia exigua]KAH6638476.1 hypothetical protein C7974DRAFT_375009 [Boeremia exigua]
MAEEHLASEVTKRIHDYLESIYDSSDDSLAEDEEPEPKRRLRTVYGASKKIDRPREKICDCEPMPPKSKQAPISSRSYPKCYYKKTSGSNSLDGDISRLKVERDEKEDLLGLKAVELDDVQKTAKSDVERLAYAQRALHNVSGNMERTLQQLEQLLQEIKIERQNHAATRQMLADEQHAHRKTHSKLEDVVEPDTARLEDAVEERA